MEKLASTEEAQEFGTAIEGVIADLDADATYIPPVQEDPPTKESDVKAVPDRRVPEKEARGGEVHNESAAAPSSMREVPAAREFQLTRRQMTAAEPAWAEIETLLKLTYPSRLQAPPMHDQYATMYYLPIVQCTMSMPRYITCLSSNAR